ncbi:diguanylate cyclase [Thauera phenylacetica B4P]|jgi:diguanylate cyclase (GGDEF)-like protein/PAS domain S-box-containing protein|uniref:diguanylate cyclase n=1 Tax=Thauera phenylacetica B4P TaxID=1234382 RepID=N6YZ11_9RHOO|nr:sensor domain-containing diguanylate cyclase [Thauera phenylacetica]ENO96825.1 diguanylate cyclase [Thauera phenylacetica B4P]
MNSTCDPLPAPALRAEADDAVFERAYVEGLLRDRESLWHALFAQSRDGVVVLDEAGKVYETNQRFADLLGYTMDEMYQLHVWDWAHGPSPEELRAMIREIGDDGHHFETQQVRKDGSLVDIELSNSRTFFRGQKLIFCICRDITARKVAERRIRYLATTDTLTGATNRGEFSRRLAEEIACARQHGTPLGLVMFDLDHFKRINDSHGHDAGDAVLRGVMEVVRQSVRVGDVIGRWGGEEFMLLLPGSDLADALGAAERLRVGIEAQDFEPVERVTASFGVVVLAPAEGFDALVKRADVALYRAKSAGRNRVETVSGD